MKCESDSLYKLLSELYFEEAFTLLLATPAAWHARQPSITPMCEVCDLEQRLEHWLEHFNQQSTPCPTMTPPSRRQKRKRVGVGDEEYAVVNQMGRSDSKSRSLSIQNDYRGYSFQEQWSSSPSPPPRRDLETVDAASTTPHSFFRRFVSLRKPCILKGYDGISVDPNDLSRVAGKEVRTIIIIR